MQKFLIEGYTMHSKAEGFNISNWLSHKRPFKMVLISLMIFSVTISVRQPNPNPTTNPNYNDVYIRLPQPVATKHSKGLMISFLLSKLLLMIWLSLKVYLQ